MENKRSPLRRLNSVFHVGTLDPSHKGTSGHSQEGAGLSISLHPQEWSQIARLAADTTYRLTLDGGRFLDFHRLSDSQRASLQDWGIANGWLEMSARWQVEHFDDEDEQVRRFFVATEQEAIDELESILYGDTAGEHEKITKVDIPVLTEKARSRIGFKQDDIFALDMAATFWVEDETDYDGVWWNDNLDVLALSAPRGVILKSRLSRWNTSLIKKPARAA